MFGRLDRAAKRAVGDTPTRSCGVLKTFDPQMLAGVAAIGLGAAGGLGGGGSATGHVADKVSSWGAREHRRYVALPHKVLVVVTDEDVRLHEWSALGAGKQLGRWAAGTFRADRFNGLGEIGVRRTLEGGKVALLSGRGGWLHRGTHQLVDAILSSAGVQPSDIGGRPAETPSP